jgi:hypothetical protein
MVNGALLLIAVIHHLLLKHGGTVAQWNTVFEPLHWLAVTAIGHPPSAIDSVSNYLMYPNIFNILCADCSFA